MSAGGIVPNLLAILFFEISGTYKNAYFFPSLLGFIIMIVSYLKVEKNDERLNRLLKMDFKTRFNYTIRTVK